MLDRIDCIHSFVRAVELGSFSAVAKEQDTTQPTISKQIAALEAYLDAQLFVRTTRKLQLTDAGKDFYEHSIRLLEIFAETESSVGKRQEPTGLLRLSCSTWFGKWQVIPRIQRFHALYPHIEIDLCMADFYTNLVEENIDLAIRVGNFISHKSRSERIGRTRLITVATPEYLSKFGIPKHPIDLSDHNCIVYTRQSTLNEWHFQENSQEIIVSVHGNLQVNDSSALKEIALAGVGIVTSPLLAFQEELKDHKIRIILEAFEPPPLPIQAVYLRSSFRPAKVNCFIDFLIQELKQLIF
ncbi:MAG: LysR family transcriptional regulator [Oscillatoriales cyanobacterium SM2_2_1]|nr:LysR family transcriptional regulator [Oscillatoriales cyanobacterium SM2_2_1]